MSKKAKKKGSQAGVKAKRKGLKRTDRDRTRRERVDEERERRKFFIFGKPKKTAR